MPISRLNHTQISNDFLDNYIQDLSGASVLVFLAICRKTIGWHKDTDSISYSQLESITGLSRSTISTAIEELESLSLIIVDRTGADGTNQYTISYSEEGSSKIELGVVRKSNRGGSSKIEHTKDIDIIKDKDIYTVPQSIFQYWNGSKLIVHKKLTPDITRAIKSALEKFSAVEIQKAISNYQDVVRKPEYYWTHLWTLRDFLKRGIDRFVDEAKPLENFKVRAGGINGVKPVRDETYYKNEGRF